jgi:hypothetical protein
MRGSELLTVVAALVAALPFGWGLGVLAAYILAGQDFGQLPVLTVPLGLLTGVIVAVAPFTTPRKRLAILLAGDGAFLLLAWLAR